MKNFSKLIQFALLAFFLIFFQNFMAQSPEKMSYQSIIRNASNALFANQAVGVRVSVLQTSSSGTEIYKETFSPNPSTNANGLLSLEIGTGTPVTGTFPSINWSSGTYFVKVEIDPAGGTNYSLISNSQLLSVPYALSAKTAQSVAGISGTSNLLPKFTSSNTLGNSQIKDDGTSIGVNVASLSPNRKFEVFGNAINNSIRGTLNATPSTSIATSGSIYGESTTGIGVIGVSGTQNGVYGLSTGTLGGTVGVATGTGNGIWGVATGRGIIVSTGASGFGTSTPTARLEVRQPATPLAIVDDNAAIVGYSYGIAAAKKGGVNGTYNTFNYGTGIHGKGYQGVDLTDANATFGTGNQDLGVFGSANTAGVEGVSVGGIGVVGYNKNSSFAATTGGGNTYGVYGYANTIGGATVPNTRYGVYGYATGATTNHAGYFSGNVQVTGSISKGSGTFKIDHPLDPENKYLYHSFVESPDMMNVYNGNITTDNNGYATVKLPAYFDALNKDFRYQLTVIGTFANAIVAQEVKDNTFIVRTDKPSVKVSWQVTGIRNDGYAKAHRVVPEVEKEPEFKGKYLYPVEMGKSKSLGIDEFTRPKDPSQIKKDIKEEKSVKAAPSQQNKDEIAGVTITAENVKK